MEYEELERMLHLLKSDIDEEIALVNDTIITMGLVDSPTKKIKVSTLTSTVRAIFNRLYEKMEAREDMTVDFYESYQTYPSM